MKHLATNTDEVGRWVAGRLGIDWIPGKAHAVGLTQDGTLIAGVIFDSCNGASVCMHVAAVPGRGWLNRAYLWTCFAYPFLQLRVKKVIGLVGSDNTDALRFDHHLGFVHEATLKDAHPNGDLLVLTMTKDQCRWLSLKVPHYGQFSRQAEGSSST